MGVDDGGDVWINGPYLTALRNDDFYDIVNSDPRPLQCLAVSVRVPNTNPTEL
jgi:hypothetical protein